MTDQERHQQNIEKILGLDPAMVPMVEELLERAEIAGHKLRITHGYRSVGEQNELFAQGRTKPGAIVTNARGGESFHNFGLAIDVFDHSQTSYSTVDWNAIAEIAAAVGLEHGDRGYQDLPHFQYRGGLSLEEVQQGKRPPLLEKYQKDKLTIEDMERIQKLEERMTKVERGLQSVKDRKFGRRRVRRAVTTLRDRLKNSSFK